MAICSRCSCRFFGGASRATLCAGCTHAARMEEEERDRPPQPKPFSREWREALPEPDTTLLRALGVSGIAVLGTLDHRSCHACLLHDGTFYTVDEWDRLQPLPCKGCTCGEEDGVVPDPPHCRCTDITHVGGRPAPDPMREAQRAELLAWLDAPETVDPSSAPTPRRRRRRAP